MRALDGDFTPLSDLRASADYRRQVARRTCSSACGWKRGTHAAAGAGQRLGAAVAATA